MHVDVERVSTRLKAFDFATLFIEELGWANPVNGRSQSYQHDDIAWNQRPIAHLAGVVVLEITTSDGSIPLKKDREIIHKQVEKHHFEHILLFVDSKRSQSVWSWMRREGKKSHLRDHVFVHGQTGDLLISKLAAMFFDLSDFDAAGNVTVGEVARRVQQALDVERVIKKFYREYDSQRLRFVERIQGISDPHDQRWYASVMLHRLMFVYFLQKKGFINRNFLTNKLNASKQNAPNHYFQAFLLPLFFEGFAKPKGYRSDEYRDSLGSIPYLNGGLFLRHELEEKYPHIDIPDGAFEELFALFERYSWHLDDTPAGSDDQINPDVLGYIFEKYINDQKSAGAYYTRVEITQYLCEQTIYPVVLSLLQQHYAPAKAFSSLPDLILKLDAPLCKVLLFEVLPNVSVLDPACGSGAFLIAALKTLFDIYSAAVGRIEFLNDPVLDEWLRVFRNQHPSIGYAIKRNIIANNIYGVDLMTEGMEIARLRLFLALVSSVHDINQLEPLPNIDFNIVAGNSLLGLLEVDSQALPSFFGRPYVEIVEEKDRLIEAYRHKTDYDPDLERLRDTIRTTLNEHSHQLNGLLEEQFMRYKIRYERPVWDDTKQAFQKNLQSRLVDRNDLAKLRPFHWGYQFNRVLKNGGFDVIIANPPWEVWKPQGKEFFLDFVPDIDIAKNTTLIKEFETKKDQVLRDNPSLREAWIQYQERFPHLSEYFRTAPQFKHQTSVVNGKKTGSDVNLYKLFTEQCYNLLRHGGMCGIVLPSGIYTDLGSKGLRELLFDQTKIHSLFGFENRKEIFEGVHRSFKFVVLTFEKGGVTTEFPAAFMQLNVDELSLLPSQGAITVSVDLIKQLSPDSLSIMEFKHPLDGTIALKMLDFPLLREQIQGTWNLSLSREFDMTNHSHLFATTPAAGHLPLYEGKMIHQFTHRWAEPRYWVDEKQGRAALLKSGETDHGQVLDYQRYRLGFRAIASNTNERSLIASIIPRNVFCGNSVITTAKQRVSLAELCFSSSLLNSFIIDWILRIKVTTNINMFYIHQLPVPRLTEADPQFKPIVERAARLICTTPEYDELARSVGLRSHKDGATNEVERAKLRAELDGLIAHLYRLTEEEFTHILRTFPLVPEPTRLAAHNAYRDVARGLVK